MQYEWVIGSFKGDKGKQVKELANAGVGYFVRQEAGRGTEYTVEVAFKRAIDSPTPEHLVPADLFQSEKLEKLARQRMGIREK